MKRLALAISLAVLGTGSAFAADLAPSYTKAPVMASVYNWTGFYVGGNLGYGWGRTSDDVNFLRSAVAFGAVPFSVSADLKGVLGGVQAGYNWQIQRVVFGIEADIDAADIKGSPFQAVLSDFGGRFRVGPTALARRSIGWAPCAVGSALPQSIACCST